MTKMQNARTIPVCVSLAGNFKTRRIQSIGSSSPIRATHYTRSNRIAKILSGFQYFYSLVFWLFFSCFCAPASFRTPRGGKSGHALSRFFPWLKLPISYAFEHRLPSVCSEEREDFWCRLVLRFGRVGIVLSACQHNPTVAEGK